MSAASDPVAVVLIVAAARNGVIGRDGDMPWRLPTDLKHFKALTLGKPVVMGRKTWASIGRALPGRPNIVVTRDPQFLADGAEVIATLDGALALATQKALALGASEVCVIGGGEIYRAAIDRADAIEMTIVQAEIAGDTTFPEIDPETFEKVTEETPPRAETDSHAMVFTRWQRRSAPS